MVDNNNLPNKAAINKEIGLSQYDGDENVYLDVMDNFAKNNNNKLRILNDAIAQGDIKLSHRTAHSLRGAAGTIGAIGLANASFEVEKTLALMDDNGTDSAAENDLEKQIQLLENEFEAVFNELNALVGEKEEVTFYSGGDIDRIKTLELIDKLVPYLGTGDTKCLEYMDEVDQIFRPAAGEFQLFISQMEQYDFELAYDTIERIRRFMNP